MFIIKDISAGIPGKDKRNSQSFTRFGTQIFCSLTFLNTVTHIWQLTVSVPLALLHRIVMSLLRMSLQNN
jgi:hypothetical protein